jgi:hypothetical protein
MAAVVAAVVFGVAIFFKVNTIEVQGNAVYSAEQIIKASGIEKGDNLLTDQQAHRGGQHHRPRLPYIESVSIGRTLPDTVVIKVQETDATFAVTTDTNTVWLINPSGKAIEKVNTLSSEEYSQLLGVTINNPAGRTEGHGRQPGESRRRARGAGSALDGTGITEHIASLDVTKDYDIVLWYGDQYEIRLGGTEQLDYKVQYLSAILGKAERLSAGHHRPHAQRRGEDRDVPTQDLNAFESAHPTEKL